METPTYHACTHCACHNPILDVLSEDLFHHDHLPKITNLLSHFTEPDAQSLVIHGGIIRPLIGGEMTTVQAIGMHLGKVEATGSLDAVLDHMNSKGIKFTTKQLEPQQTLLPGLIEPHVHIVPTALMEGWLDLGGFDEQNLRTGYTLDWLTQTIEGQVEAHKLKYGLGAWILGRGLDPALMPLQTLNGEQELITISYEILDKIEDKVPIFIISASMHTAYVNTSALQIIYKSDPALKTTYPTFTDYQNQTNGQLQEEAGMQPGMKAIPKAQIIGMALDSFKHLTEIFETANSRGVTFMYDAGMDSKMKVILDAYLLFHQKKLRIGAAQLCYTSTDAEKLPHHTPMEEYSDVYYGNIKLVSDGSNQGLTGFQSEPYCCNPPNNYGIFNFAETGTPHPKTTPVPYIELVKKIAVDKGWPMMIHANGDEAVKFAIDVYKHAHDAALIKEEQELKRHRIEHCSILTKEQVLEMKALGLSPSFLIGHVGYWGFAFKQAIFKDKAKSLDLCKTALDAGLRISLHSDNEVSPLGPLRMMEQSITRMMEGGPEGILKTPLTPTECISHEQALRAVTYDAAWQCHADKWVGSLETGYFADFVILEQDPLTMEDPYQNMRNIPVLETWKGGTLVYETATLKV